MTSSKDTGTGQLRNPLLQPEVSGDIDSAIDEILELSGFQIFPAGANENRLKAKAALKALIAEERDKAIRDNKVSFSSLDEKDRIMA